MHPVVELQGTTQSGLEAGHALQSMPRIDSVVVRAHALEHADDEPAKLLFVADLTERTVEVERRRAVHHGPGAKLAHAHAVGLRLERLGFVAARDPQQRLVGAIGFFEESFGHAVAAQEAAGEHQLEALRRGQSDVDVGHTRGDAEFVFGVECFLEPLRECGKTFGGDLTEQRFAVGEVVPGRRVRNPEASGKAAERQAVDAVFLDHAPGFFDQCVAQVSVVIRGFGHRQRVYLDAVRIFSKLDSVKFVLNLEAGILPESPIEVIAMVFPGRYSAQIEGDFVVFLIGARVNRLSKLLTFVPIARAMSRMQQEVLANPELGCLHIENWFGRTTMSVQYWRSFEHLEAYSRNPSAEHLPAWRDFNKKVRDNGSIGIWHETFKVREGEYEAIYGNMHQFGLGVAGEHGKASLLSTAARRSGARPDDVAPVEAY